MSNPLESLNPLKPAVASPLPALTRGLFENPGATQLLSICPKCSENCEKEQAKLAAIEKSFSEAKQDTVPSLPAWLQNAKLNAVDAITEDESQVVIYARVFYKIQLCSVYNYV